jgi:hypothetical protein
MDTWKVIELLECAKINVENIRRGGHAFIELSKMQIDEAIKLLEEEEKE